MTILIGRDPPRLRQATVPEPSIINEKTVADFARSVDFIWILRSRHFSPACDAAATGTT
jgi:hypothetical protein